MRSLRAEGWTKSAWLDSLGLQELTQGTGGEFVGKDSPLQRFLQDLLDKHPSLETVRLSFRNTRSTHPPVQCYRVVFARRSLTREEELKHAIEIHDAFQPRMKHFLSVLFSQNFTSYKESWFGSDVREHEVASLKLLQALYSRKQFGFAESVAFCLYPHAYGP